MFVKLLTEQHLELLSVKGDWTGSSESTFVKIPHCWKSHVMVQLSWMAEALIELCMAVPNERRGIFITQV